MRASRSTSSVFSLCLSLDVRGEGSYQKDGKRIVDAVTQVGKPDPAFYKNISSVVEELDKDRFVFKRSTGWLIALLISSSLGGVVYLSTSFFIQEHQVEHLVEQGQQLKNRLGLFEQQKTHLEKQIVRLQTRLKNLEEAQP